MNMTLILVLSLEIDGISSFMGGILEWYFFSSNCHFETFPHLIILKYLYGYALRNLHSYILVCLSFRYKHRPLREQSRNRKLRVWIFRLDGAGFLRQNKGLATRRVSQSIAVGVSHILGESIVRVSFQWWATSPEADKRIHVYKQV